MKHDIELPDGTRLEATLKTGRNWNDETAEPKPSSGSNFRLAALFHDLPKNTTFPQARSGVSIFSAHHSSIENSAPFGIFLP